MDFSFLPITGSSIDSRESLMRHGVRTLLRNETEHKSEGHSMTSSGNTDIVPSSYSIVVDSKDVISGLDGSSYLARYHISWWYV